MLFDGQPCYVIASTMRNVRVMRVMPPWPLSCGTPYMNDFAVKREEVRILSVLEKLAYAGEGWIL